MLPASQFTTKFGKQPYVRDLVTRILSATDLDTRGFKFKIAASVPYPTACGKGVEIPAGLNVYQFAESVIHEIKHLNLNRDDRTLRLTCDEIEQEVRAFTAEVLPRVRSVLTSQERMMWDSYLAEIEALRALARRRP